jgi:parallel beta-helix repeat protein
MRKLYLCLFILFVVFCALSRPTWATNGTMTIMTNMQLTEPHHGNIIIAANNVVLDCADFTVDGGNTGFDVGILLVNRIGVTVQRCNVTGFAGDGISLLGAAINVFRSNNVHNNGDDGVSLVESTLNIFTDNEVSENVDDGFDLEDSSKNQFTNNTVMRNGVVAGQPCVMKPKSNGFSLDVASNGNVFVGNEITCNADRGISLDDSSNNTFINNTVTENPGVGIHFGTGNPATSTGKGSMSNAFVLNYLCGNNPTGGNNAPQITKSTKSVNNTIQFNTVITKCP